MGNWERFPPRALPLRLKNGETKNHPQIILIQNVLKLNLTVNTVMLKINTMNK